MKFGIRECANITFRAKKNEKIGNKIFSVGQPILYIDSANMSTLEQQTVTSYASGGRNGNRLISWEGEKSIIFNVTDALLSSVSLSLLDGTELIKEMGKDLCIHSAFSTIIDIEKRNGVLVGVIDLTEDLLRIGSLDGINAVKVDTNKMFYVIRLNKDESTLDNLFNYTAIVYANGKIVLGNITSNKGEQISLQEGEHLKENVLVDYYMLKKSNHVSEIQISPYSLPNYYYVEASTLFKSQITGLDVPVNIVFPNVKIQSGFTLTMSGSGDPSTFNFVIEAFPGYTYFNKIKKVLFVLQVLEDKCSDSEIKHSVMLNNTQREDDSYSSPFESKTVTIADLLNIKQYVDNLYPNLEEDNQDENIGILTLNTITDESIVLDENPEVRFATKYDLLKLQNYVFNMIQIQQNILFISKQSDENFFVENEWEKLTSLTNSDYVTVKDLIKLKRKINNLNPNFSEKYLNLKEG